MINHDVFMGKIFYVLLAIFTLNLSFAHSSLAQQVDCNDTNEGRRIGPYECRDGDWVLITDEEDSNESADNE